MSNVSEAQEVMGEIVVGVGGLQASKSAGEMLKTYALGSCVALLLYDSKRKIAGMVHVALPSSAINKKRAELLPGYFADTGIQNLIAEMNTLRGNSDGPPYGTGPQAKEFVVKLVGGATVLRAKNSFNIGQRNVDAVSNILKDYKLAPAGSDVGGSLSRTVSIEVDTGTVRIQCPGRGEWLI